MKKFLSVLVLAVTLQGLCGQRDAVDDAINNIVNPAIAEIKSYSPYPSQFLGRLQNAVRTLQGNVNGMLTGVNRLIYSVNNNVESQIAAAEKAGLASEECVATRRAELSDLMDTARSGLDTCTQQAGALLDPLSQRINTQVDALRGQLDSSVSTIRACVPVAPTEADLPGITACVTSEKDAILGDIQAIIGQVESLLAEATRLSEEGQETARLCLQAVGDQAQAEGKTVSQNLEACQQTL